MRNDQRKPDTSGIELSAPRLTGKQLSAAAVFLLSTFLVLLGVFGAAWCFISVFSPPILPLTVVLYTLIFVILLSSVFHLNRIRYLILPTVFAIFLAAGYYLRKEFVQGFLITTNQIMRTYARHSDYVLPIYRVAAKQADFPLMGTIFILFTVFFITFLLCWAIVRRQSAALAFLITVPFPAAALIYNISPDFYAILMLITCWALLLFMRLSGGRKQGFIRARRSYRAKSRTAAAKAGLQLLPVVILCFALILGVFPQQTYKYSQNAQNARNRLIDTVNNAADNMSLFNNGDVLAGSTDHVNLRGADSIRFTGKTMLQVQANPEYPTYLKGFTGSIYNGTSWEPLPDSDYSDINAKLNSYNVQNMSGTFFNLIGPQPSINLAPFGVQVKNVGANKKIIYSPYNLTTDPQSITGVKFINDDSIRSGWIFGTNEYTLYANSFNGEHISSNIPGVFLALSGQFGSQGIFARGTRGLWSYFPHQSQLTLINPDNVKMFCTDPIPDDLMNTLTGKGKDFMMEEQAYRLFMYDKYTQLPSGIKEKLQNLLREQKIIGGYTFRGNTVTRSSANTYGSISYIVDAVKNYLAQTCTYTLTPGRTPAGQDFTDYFLFQNHKGYCVHFATAATVLLRAMGVPARYAEGYIVTDDDYKNAVGGWANIKDNRAHAWVEVYYPGLGWQPIEVTPGFNVAENQTQDDLPPTESSVSSTPPESAQSSSTASTAESQTASSVQSAVSEPEGSAGTKSSDDVMAAMLPILSTIAVVCLIWAAAVVRRKFVLKHREKEFTQQDANKAAITIYSYMVKLTRFGGYISREAEDIALKARFSLHTVTEEELIFLRDDAKMLAHLNKSCASTAEKILMKYIYNLI